MNKSSLKSTSAPPSLSDIVCFPLFWMKGCVPILFFFFLFWWRKKAEKKKRGRRGWSTIRRNITPHHHAAFEIDGGYFYESAQKKSSHNQRAHPRPKASLKKDDDWGGDRTLDLQIRSLTPYPLGHTAIDITFVQRGPLIFSSIRV